MMQAAYAQHLAPTDPIAFSFLTPETALRRVCNRVKPQGGSVENLKISNTRQAKECLEQFKQFYSRCFAAAESAGLRQQLGQCV